MAQAEHIQPTKAKKSHSRRCDMDWLKCLEPHARARALRELVGWQILLDAGVCESPQLEECDPTLRMVIRLLAQKEREKQTRQAALRRCELAEISDSGRKERRI